MIRKHCRSHSFSLKTFIAHSLTKPTCMATFGVWSVKSSWTLMPSTSRLQQQRELLHSCVSVPPSPKPNCFQRERGNNVKCRGSIQICSDCFQLRDLLNFLCFSDFLTDKRKNVTGNEQGKANSISVHALFIFNRLQNILYMHTKYTRWLHSGS